MEAKRGYRTTHPGLTLADMDLGTRIIYRDRYGQIRVLAWPCLCCVTTVCSVPDLIPTRTAACSRPRTYPPAQNTPSQPILDDCIAHTNPNEQQRRHMLCYCKPSNYCLAILSYRPMQRDPGLSHSYAHRLCAPPGMGHDLMLRLRRTHARDVVVNAA
ncbi:hypothetical protein F503_04571 [Ophiostoma piceae UAMH 11346]|uniref:Uncharacterized protein n=1 Tax=Ophiostoma piceae (strain UAMH 11346) TaxID=1262450 RepID=S3C5Z6_OPHP1|nr:hypothetical protein F503_04571 [Ophiostoma piceae UAMH 11346]